MVRRGSTRNYVARAAGTPASESPGRSVNARMQQKRGHHDKSDTALCREFFSLDKPEPGHRVFGSAGTPALTRHGVADSKGRWTSARDASRAFGTPPRTSMGLNLSEQMALEQLAAFSLLAR